MIMNNDLITQSIKTINNIIDNLIYQARWTLISIGEYTFKNECEIVTYANGDNVYVKSFKVIGGNIILYSVLGDGKEKVLKPYHYDQLSTYKYLLSAWYNEQQQDDDVSAHDPNDPIAY